MPLKFHRSYPPTAFGALLSVLMIAHGATACRCNASQTPTRAPTQPQPRPGEEPEFETPDDAGSDARAALPPCTLGARTPLASNVGDAATDRFETPSIEWGSRGAFVAFVDRASARLQVARSSDVLSSVALGRETVSALRAIELSPERSLVFSVSAVDRARWQRAFVTEGGALRPLAARRGAADDALNLAACAVRGGALIAWDEAVSEGRSAVRVQRWTGAERAEPTTITVSAPEHDASDPVLAALPDGGAVVAYLALQEVEVEIANQSAADIVVRALGPDGAPRGEPIVLTPRPKTRFGVTLHMTSTGRWAAWRLASDSDHEGLGDGGRVAVVALGDDLRPVRTPEYLTELDVVPAGRIAIVSEGGADGRADVYWTERRGEDLVTVRRSVGRDGALLGPARDEPALAGQLPIGGPASEPTVASWGPAGEPGVARARCPR
ncbi:MAG: hypothetical protein JNK05_19455 [Myxococcales bacterium]|nr:hypothetical protein [Myxococcales bacterium]